jgi:hypothetical protein
MATTEAPERSWPLAGERRHRDHEVHAFFLTGISSMLAEAIHRRGRRQPRTAAARRQEARREATEEHRSVTAASGTSGLRGLDRVVLGGRSLRALRGLPQVPSDPDRSSEDPGSGGGSRSWFWVWRS